MSLYADRMGHTLKQNKFWLNLCVEVWCGLIGFGLIWFSLIWFGLIWFCLFCLDGFGLINYG